jgi:transcriptional regulator with XRE-family HTH domain
MTDREIFRVNLNYYLHLQDKKQKDLADFVGAKTTTVSGWTRGISYPRADAMEKIAMFFGIPTSQLVGERSDSSVSEPADDPPRTVEARSLAKGIDMMPKEQREAILNMMMGLYPGIFEKGNENDET